MLTAIFKDYLIYDDVYEFLEGSYKYSESVNAIKQYAKDQNHIATIKYGMKLNNYSVNHENIVNHPQVLVLNQQH